MRVKDIDIDLVFYLFTDHLGSTNVVTDPVGGMVSLNLYKPWGESRTDAGTALTDYGFTGQRKLDDSIGLIYYGSRFYDPYLTQFSQPDTIIPDPYNPLDWNRYQYARSNPLRYNDPSGHWIETVWDIANIGWDIYEVQRDPSALNIGALVVDVAAAALPFIPAGAGLIVRGGKAAKAAVEITTHADDVVDAAKTVDKIVDAGKAVEASGQWHHILSKKIMDGLKGTNSLKSAFERDDFLVQALDEASHKGYQDWHRKYDQKVVDWLTDNPDASKSKFLEFLQDIYKESDMENKFPDAWKQLQDALEETK